MAQHSAYLLLALTYALVHADATIETAPGVYVPYPPGKELSPLCAEKITIGMPSDISGRVAKARLSTSAKKCDTAHVLLKKVATMEGLVGPRPFPASAAGNAIEGSSARRRRWRRRRRRWRRRRGRGSGITRQLLRQDDSVLAVIVTAKLTTALKCDRLAVANEIRKRWVLNVFSPRVTMNVFNVEFKPNEFYLAYGLGPGIRACIYRRAGSGGESNAIAYPKKKALSPQSSTNSGARKFVKEIVEYVTNCLDPLRRLQSDGEYICNLLIL